MKVKVLGNLKPNSFVEIYRPKNLTFKHVMPYVRYNEPLTTVSVDAEQHFKIKCIYAINVFIWCLNSEYKYKISKICFVSE